MSNTFLFFDDKNLLTVHGIKRRYGTPKLLEIYRDPVAKTSTGMPSVWYNEDSDEYMMFYNGHTPDAEFPLVATSKDGIHFSPRSTVGESDLETRHVDHQMMEWCGELAAVYVDKTAPKEKRLKALTALGDFNTQRIITNPLYTSGDGIHWTKEPVQWHNNGAEPGAMCFYNHVTGKHTIIARPDPGVRRVCIIETDDFERFTDVRLVMTPDSCDEPLAEHYGMPTFPYKGMFVSFLWIYHAPNVRERKYWGGTLDAQLVYSYNGQNFQRSLREPFFHNGDVPETAGLLAPSCLYETQEGRLLIAASACSKEQGYVSEDGSILIYELRPDGFISLHADGEGDFSTIPMVYEGGELFVNAAAEALTCALYTDDSDEHPLELGIHPVRPIDGFGHEDFIPFSGDNTHLSLQWKNHSLDELTGKILYLEFKFSKGDVYSVSGSLTPMMICDLARYHLYGTIPDITGIG